MTHSFNPTVLREYDIRGIVGQTLGTDDAYAIGVFSPQLPQEGIGYGRFTFPDVNKWNCVFRELNVQPNIHYLTKIRNIKA